MGNAAEELPRKLKLDVHEYHRMAEAGVLDAHRRVELIHGEIIEMPPVGPLHVNLVNRLNRTLTRAVGELAVVSVQNPVLLPEHSEPEPDLVLLRPEADARPTELPAASDTLLVVEVADTTLRHDRDVKVPLYAGHGVPEVWLVEVRARRIVRFREVRDGAYGSRDVPSLRSPLALLAASDIAVDLSRLFDG